MRRTLRFVLASPVLAASLLAQKPVATVQGRVLGPDGLPMPNVEVLAKAHPLDAGVLAKGRSDGDGMFVLAHLPDDRTVWVVAQPPGYTRSLGRADLSPERPYAGVALRVYEANTLRGRVVDPEGKPIAGASVLGTKDLVGFVGNLQPIETRSDGDGRFELRGVPIGDCVVRAHASGFAVREYWLTAFADTDIDFPPLLRDDSTTLSIAIEGLRADETANVRVRSWASRGGSGIYMPSSVGSVVPAADGSLLLAGLPDAEWSVEPSGPGLTFEPRWAMARAGERKASLRFRASRDGVVVLRGRLTDVAGKPLANETLVCRPRGALSEHGMRLARTKTDADGRFALDAPLTAGEGYSLRLVGSTHVLSQGQRAAGLGSEDPRLRVLWLDVADPARELALVAQPAAMLTVSLRNADKLPVPFTWLELQRSDRMRVEHATTTRDGIATFAGMHGGDEDLVVVGSGPGGSVLSRPFLLQAGEQKRLELVVTPPGRIEGLVVDAAGNRLAGVRVSLRNVDLATGRPREGSYPEVPTDRLGRFVFPSVAAGGCRVEVGATAKTDGRGMSEPFEVLPNKKVDVEVRVTR